MESSPQPNPLKSTEAPYDLGILFVHGIGDQAKGSTLVEFGTPLYEWLAERASAVGGSVQISDALVMPASEVPAHSEFLLQAQGTNRRWLLAESWWAESFAAPRFSDFARWGLGVAPRTFGSHFGAALARAWRLPKVTACQQLTRMGRVTIAFINLIVGVALSFLMLVFLLLLLGIGIIPVRRLRESIVKVQLRLASSIGDCYILVDRPMESAAILSRFVSNLRWLENRCQRVAIVAHSQGGAVACLALQKVVGSSTRLLVTFGSGLRKLEELSELRSRPSFRRGALLTIFGLAVAAITLIGFPNVIRQVHLQMRDVEFLLVYTAYSAIGWTILVAGVRDFIVGIDSQRLEELGKALSGQVSQWTDIYASADPVPNGRLHEKKEIAPFAVPVVNFYSIFRDHTSYWRNHDEFVARLSDILLRFDGALATMFLPKDTLKFLTKRRAARVNYLRFSWWIGVLFSVALLFRYSAEWAVVLSWADHRTATWIIKALGLHTETTTPGFAYASSHDWWYSVGLLALVTGAYAIVRAVWSTWNRLEMHHVPVIKCLKSQKVKFVAALWLLLVVGGGTLLGDFPPLWMFFGSLAVAVAFPFTSWPSAPPGVIEAEKERSFDARAERAARFFWALLSIGVMIYGVPMAILAAVGAIHRYLPLWIPGGKLSWLVSFLVLVVGWVILSLIVAYVAPLLIRLVRRSSAP
jgi:hypothetical protein